MILVLLGAVPTKLLGADGFMSPVAVAVSVLVSAESCGSVYVAVMVVEFAQVRVPLLLVSDPVDIAVARPALRNTSVAAPVSVNVIASESVGQDTTTPERESALPPLRLPS